MSASPSRGNRSSQVSPQPWEKVTGFAFGVLFITAILVLAIAFPQPTSFQYEVFRIVLAIACGGVAAVIPGFLAVSMDAPRLVLRAGGALAVFILVYFFSPARLVTSTSSPVSQPNITATERSIAAGGNITATAQPGGTAIITTGNVNVDVKEIVDSLVKAHERELSGFHEREQVYQDQVKALTGAVTALAKQEGPRIADAVAQLRQGNTAAAEVIFQDILTRKTDEGQSANKQAAEAAGHLGALVFLHDTDKALAAYRQAVRLDPENAAAWIQLGHLLWRTGQLDSAEDAYRKALTLGEKASNRSLIASAYGSLGNVYMVRGDFPQAEAMYHKALPLYNALGDKEGMAITYGNLGIVYRTRGDLDQAEAMYRKALELDKVLGRKTGMASTYSNLGTLHRTRGDLDQAEAMYRKALELDEALGDKAGMGRTYGNLGVVYRTRGDLDQAEAMGHKALKLCEALGDKTCMAGAYGELAYISGIRGDLPQAEAMQRKALQLCEAIGDKAGMAKIYGDLGLTYGAQGDSTQAEAMHRKALELDEAIGYKEGTANQYGNLGLVYWTRGDFPQAEAMYHKALPLYNALGDKEGMAKSYVGLGLVYSTQGDLPQSETMYRKALALFQKIGATFHVEHVQELLHALQLQKSR